MEDNKKDFAFQTTFKVDGSLEVSREFLDRVYQYIEGDGGGVDEIVEAKRYPQVLPLVDFLETLSKRAVEKAKILINHSIERFSLLNLNYNKIFGEKILVCGFPLHIRNILKDLEALIRVVPPPLAKGDEKKYFKEAIENFEHENNRKIEICDSDFEAITDSISWADSILTEIYGIRKTLDTAGAVLVQVPDFSASVIPYAYSKRKPSFMVGSRLQCDALFPNRWYNDELAGRPVPYSYFEEVIMENGPMYFSQLSVFGRSWKR